MKIKWAQIIDKYINKPYELGGWGNPGYDCFSVLVSILKDSGLYIPRNSEWNGIKINDYKNLWEEDEVKSKRFIREAFNKYLIKHDGPAQQGDVLLLTCGNEGLDESFLSLHASNKIISAIKQRGVIAFPTKYFKIHGKYKVNYEVS